MAKNRPLRPGETKPTAAPARGGTKSRAKRPNNNPGKPKKKGGGGNSPPGITPPGPYLNTDEGRDAANIDPQAYLDHLYGAAGFSDSGGPFHDWLMQDRSPNLIANWNAAALTNPELKFTQYMNTQGVPLDAGLHTPGPQQTIGTGTAFDSGNPFTSSSGVGGIPPLPSPTAPTVPQGKAPIAVNPFNKKKKPNAFKRWNRNQIGQPATVAPVANPATPTVTNLGNFGLEQRMKFLGLSPERRGEKAVDSYSGRWAAWG